MSTDTVTGFIVLPNVVKIEKWRQIRWAVYIGRMVKGKGAPITGHEGPEGE